MNSPEPDINPKDRAFRAIGRNLVNLQRLERILKLLAGFRPIACRLPDFATEVERRRKRTEVSTLGIVIGQWLETAEGKEPEAPAEESELDVLVSISLNLHITEDVLEEHAKELDQIRIERNRFVHTALAEIDFSSPEMCENLIASLDEQNQRVGKQIDFLLPIANRIRELNQAMLADEVQEDIRKELFKERTRRSDGENIVD